MIYNVSMETLNPTIPYQPANQSDIILQVVTNEDATDVVQPLIIHEARVPSKLSHPRAKCDGGIYVTVEWPLPEDDGEADITGYVIKYGEYSIAVDDYATVEVAGNTTNFQFTGQLKEKTLYQFAVAAVNTNGRGEFSNLSSFNTRTGK